MAEIPNRPLKSAYDYIVVGAGSGGAAVARATAAGGSVVREAQDSPYGRFAIVADPSGATLAVMRLPES